MARRLLRSSVRLGALALLAPASVLAHPLDVGYLEVHLDGAELRARFDVGAPLAIDLAHLTEEQQSPEALVAAAPLLARTLLESGTLQADGAPCEWQPEAQATVEGLRIKLTASARCPHPPAKLTWTLPFLDDAPLATRVLGKAIADGRTSEFLLEPGRQTIALEGSPPRTPADFVHLGAQHLGASLGAWLSSDHRLRLPEGVDFLLFLLALLLAGGPLRQRLPAVGAFLAGELLAFAAASQHLVHLPPKLVLCALALALVLIAAEDALDEPGGHRSLVAGALGLLYGLALALALGPSSSAGASTAGFGLGAELGQAAALLVAGAVIELARRRPRVEVVARRGLALALVGVGLCQLGLRLMA